LKIYNLIPVTAEGVLTTELTDCIGKYLNKDTELVSGQISEGPVTIESEYEDAIAAPFVLELCKKAEKEGCDAIFINCFADPGVRAAREIVNIPVFGGFEPAMHIALGLGDKIGIVTVLKNIVPLIRGNVAKMHLEHRVSGVRSIDIPVLGLANHEKMCDALYQECRKAIELEGAEVIVLGCTGMIGVSETVGRKLNEAGYDVPIVEAGQAALTLLELYAKMGFRQSRQTYMAPPQK